MEEFKLFLLKQNLSEKTIESYIFSVERYLKLNNNRVSKKRVLEYKTYLIENFSPKTANLRMQALNKYLDFIERPQLKVRFIKVQQKNFLENVISDADYTFLKTQLKKDNKMDWYFVVRYLCATGARVSELVQLKFEHVLKGYYDIYSKGGKVRRLYIPEKLQEETLEYFGDKNRANGYLFLNKDRRKITTRGIATQLKLMAKFYGINPEVVYPHSFRHRFAKNFLENYNDISLLADLMGHESIETTRIYLRRTSTEQQEIVNKVVIW